MKTGANYQFSQTYPLTRYQLLELDTMLQRIASTYGATLETVGTRRQTLTDKSLKIPYYCNWNLNAGEKGCFPISLRPTARDRTSSDKAFQLTISYDDTVHSRKLLAIIESHVLKSLPGQFFNMEQFYNHLENGDETDIIALSPLMMPAAQQAVKDLFQDWQYKDRISWAGGGHDREPRTHRIEMREGTFEYIETNRFDVYEKNGMMVAVGISSSCGVFDDPVYQVTCFNDKAHMTLIREIFDSQFQALLEKHVDFRGGKYDGRLQIIRHRDPFRLQDLVVEDALRQTLQREIFGFFGLADYYRQAGLPFKRGIILYGPPGTGKTMLVKIVTSQMPHTVIWVRPEDCHNGESIQRIFHLARLAKPTVLVFEDADFVAVDRHLSRSGTVGELLNQLDGVVANDEILVIMTTNQLDVVEKAISDRPGRIDAKIHIGELTRDRVAELLQRKLDTFERTFADFASLLPANLKLTGAETIEMAQLIMRQAIHNRHNDNNELRITVSHVFQALKQTKENKTQKIAAGFN